MARILPPRHNLIAHLFGCVPGASRGAGDHRVTIPRIPLDPVPDPPAGPSPPTTAAPDRRRWAVPALLAVVVLLALGPLVKRITVQPGSRYSLTAAIVEQGTIQIDGFAWMTKVSDRIDAPDGHLYSDKAPGQPVLAVPFHALARAVGADSAAVKQIDGNLGLWWITLWSCTVPAAALAVLMWKVAAETTRRGAVPIALLLVFGTPLMVFSVELYGHLLATAFGFGAYVLVRSTPRSPAALAGAGACAALAVSVEYPVALLAAVLGAFLLLTGERLRLAYFAGPFVPVAALVGWYQSTAFGSALRTPYALHAVNYGRPDTETGPPRLDAMAQLLFGGRGFVLTPLVLAGLVAAVWVLRTRTGDRSTAARRDAAMALAVFGAFWLFESTRTTDWPGPLGGEMPAPRHLLPAIPFLAAPLAAAWRKASLLLTVLGGVGFLAMALPTLLPHLIPADAGYTAWFGGVLDQEGVTPTVFTLGLGGLGWVVHLGLLGGAGVLLVRAVRPVTRSASAPA